MLRVPLLLLACLFTFSAYGQECSKPGQFCYSKNTGKTLCDPCPTGTACSPWIGKSGLPGSSYCQATSCLQLGASCKDRVGVCCTPLLCTANGTGDRTCMVDPDATTVRPCSNNKRRCRKCPGGRGKRPCCCK